MSENDNTPADQEPAVETPARRRRRFPIKSAIAIALMIFVGLPIFSTLQPKYYERYSDLAPRMENWSTSTHARIACAECHVDPGLAGYASFAARSIPAFYSQLIQGPTSTNLFTVPDAVACQKCHTGFREVSSSGDLLIPHQAHVEILEINCPECHVDLVHAENTQGRNTPPMSFCLEECHDGEQASAECVDCHTRKQVPEDHLAEDWLEVHSDMATTVDCGECHAWSPDYCADCHSERPASHAGNWKNDHQFPAIERGEDGCMTCHDEEFCAECHD